MPFCAGPRHWYQPGTRAVWTILDSSTLGGGGAASEPEPLSPAGGEAGSAFTGRTPARATLSVVLALGAGCVAGSPDVPRLAGDCFSSRQPAASAVIAMVSASAAPVPNVHMPRFSFMAQILVGSAREVGRSSRAKGRARRRAGRGGGHGWPGPGPNEPPGFHLEPGKRAGRNGPDVGPEVQR